MTHSELIKRYNSEYRIYHSMKQRCYNPKNNQYKDYGGRNIGLCDSWLESFDNFIIDMGPKPTRKHSIDRINNDKDYSKENCRWATRIEQARNRQYNVYIDYRGSKTLAADLADKYGMNREVLVMRVYRGWDVEKALTTPIRKYSKK